MFPSKKHRMHTLKCCKQHKNLCYIISIMVAVLVVACLFLADRLIIFRLLLRISVLPDRHQQNKVCLSGFSTILRIGSISSYS